MHNPGVKESRLRGRGDGMEEEGVQFLYTEQFFLQKEFFYNEVQ